MGISNQNKSDEIRLAGVQVKEVGRSKTALLQKLVTDITYSTFSSVNVLS